MLVPGWRPDSPYTLYQILQVVERHCSFLDKSVIACSRVRTYMLEQIIQYVSKLDGL